MGQTTRKKAESNIDKFEFVKPIQAEIRPKMYRLSPIFENS